VHEHDRDAGPRSPLDVQRHALGDRHPHPAERSERALGTVRPVGGARTVAAFALGYLAGTVPSADVAVRLAGSDVDLRTSGSGNPGAANAIALLGPRWGYGVMAADIAKGAVACAAGRRLGGTNGAHAAGVGAVVGHCHPVWNGFRGGKGVATSVGQCAATFPAWSLLDLGVAGAIAASPWWKRRAFAATAVASVGWVAAALAWWRRGWPNLWGPRPTAALPLAAAASSAVVLGRFLAAR
jgi:glycerol-3-phosphate acyltransferase PlsY